MLPDIEIIVGTYTDFLLGYQLIKKKENGKTKITLKATFADKSHAGSLKCLAVQGPWVASGGSDDRIFIYDMRTRAQSHILQSHTGTINALVFSQDLTHLLSGSADGRMMATRVGCWKTEGDWPKPHAGNPVTHIACHPSSRLALSLGGDQILNTWNLVKGRVAYRTNLKSKSKLGKSPDCLSWSTDGNHFTLSGALALEIWDINSASVVRHIKTPAKPICVTWLNENNCLAGLENGNIAWVSLNAKDDADPTLILSHGTRVKAMSYLNNTLVSISSAGELKIWSCDIDEQNLQLIASTNIDCRPTCLGLLDVKQFGKLPQEQLSYDTAKSQQQDFSKEKQQPRMEAEILKPRSFVSIEYDKDAKAGSKQKKKKPKIDKDKKNKNKNDNDNSNNSNESDEIQLPVKRYPTAIRSGVTVQFEREEKARKKALKKKNKELAQLNSESDSEDEIIYPYGGFESSNSDSDEMQCRPQGKPQPGGSSSSGSKRKTSDNGNMNAKHSKKK